MEAAFGISVQAVDQERGRAVGGRGGGRRMLADGISRRHRGVLVHDAGVGAGPGVRGQQDKGDDVARQADNGPDGESLKRKTTTGMLALIVL